MQATLTFTLPEEQPEFNEHLKGPKYSTLLFDLRNQFIRWGKQDKEPTFDEITDHFYNLLTQYGCEF